MCKSKYYHLHFTQEEFKLEGGLITAQGFTPEISAGFSLQDEASFHCAASQPEKVQTNLN